jgi:hypothetical protein
MGDFEGHHQVSAVAGYISIMLLIKARCVLHSENEEKCNACLLAAGPPLGVSGGGSREMQRLRGLGGCNTYLSRGGEARQARCKTRDRVGGVRPAVAD